MNIKILTPHECNTIRKNHKARVNISKIGVFTFSRKATENLNLVKGLTIVFVQDADRPQDWYIAHDSKGFKLRETGGSLRFTSAVLRTKIIESLKEKPARPGVSFLVSTVPVPDNGLLLYAIITSKPL
jgi:hypothetical protein